MTSGLVIALIVVAVILVLVAVVLSSQRARVKRDEARRIEADEHREKARTRASSRPIAKPPKRRNGSRRRSRKLLSRSHQAEEAGRTCAEAAELDQRARELDPDEDTSDSKPV